MTDHSTPPLQSILSIVPSEDSDAQETAEWLDAFDAVLRHEGGARAQFLFDRLASFAQSRGIRSTRTANTPYINTIPVEKQPPYPGDTELEEKISAAIRWNAIAMVVKANREYGELGGHIASYASAADLFEVGFNHFFRADSGEGGDLVYFQPHSSPGIYARAFLEGFLDEDRLTHYRREITGNGLCSYPHPWLMPDFWQFPTGSMGIGPINAIYQARFMRYLQHRGLVNTETRKVWGFFGDGEMDEPEALGGLSIAAREKLDNLVFVINCNLQRLDGPVRGNGRIIDELEAVFAGAGWNVIKVLWGSDWDLLFARDHANVLAKAFSKTVDGQFQTFSANDGAYNRERFFGQNPELAALVASMSDDEIDRLHRGGHDMRKLHAAYAEALTHRGQPTVILAKTMKGFGMGSSGQGRMTTHQQKKLDLDDLKDIRDRFRLPIADADLDRVPFYKPAEDSPEMRYLRERRDKLGGFLPRRRQQASATLTVPPLASYARFALESAGKEMSTTMVVVRLMDALLKDKELGPRVVPIVADEARTFGMANMFRQVGIYSPSGQMYEPEDMGSMLYYREERGGQILEEGISEAGAMSSWIAAATSYSVHDFPMLPFYIYYSMFGFQRVGDVIWAAADQRSRGFLIGATAGRTTLGGEGLQHQDGFSHVAAAAVPNCRAYDPAFSYELAVIIDEGMRSMLERQEDVFYYVTVMNENYAQPSMPPGVEADLLRGMYRYGGHAPANAQGHVRLLGSGAILPEVIQAAALLAADWQVASDIYSVTSYPTLAREAQEVVQWNLHHPQQPARQSHVATMLAGDAPVVAASDYVKALPDSIAPYVQAPCTVLGTDGFGRSDTRAALRSFFEVDRHWVCVNALQALAKTGAVAPSVVEAAMERYGIRRDFSTAS